MLINFPFFVYYIYIIKKGKNIFFANQVVLIIILCIILCVILLVIFIVIISKEEIKMNKIIGVINVKGGVKKSTVAVHLSKYFATKCETLLVDGDKQGTSSTWAEWRKNTINALQGEKRWVAPVTVSLQNKQITNELPSLARNYKYTVIDVGGKDNYGVRCALTESNYVIVPVGISGFDSTAMTEMVELIDAAKTFNQSLKVKCYFTGIDNRLRDVDRLRTLEFLSENNLDIFTNQMSSRIAYVRSTDLGLTVDEMLTKKDRDTIAINEMNDFYKEVEEFIEE